MWPIPCSLKLPARVQRHLEALAAALPALPDDAQSRKALSLSIEAIVPRMHELRERLIKGGDPAAASESATLLRHLAVMGEDSLPAVGRRLVASSGPSAEETLVSLSLVSLTALLLLEQLEWRPFGTAGADGVPWAALLAWGAAVLSAAPMLLSMAGAETHAQLAGPAFAAIAMHLSLSRHLGADVRADVQAHFPALLRILLQSAGRLAMPGHASFYPGGWNGLLCCAGIIGTAKEYGEAAAAALATAGPGIQPGRQLAALVLDFLCCPADTWLSASCAAAPEAGATAAGPVALTAAAAEHDRESVLMCWRALSLFGAGPAMEPFFSAEQVRHGRSTRLMTITQGLLEQLHEQQQQQRQQQGRRQQGRRQQQWQSNACPPQPLTVDARLEVASIASSLMAEGLETYGRVLEGLLPPAQPAGQGQGPAPLQGSLLQAAQKGLRYAWHAVRALPQTAAVFTSADQTAGWDTNKDRFHAYQGASAFTKLVQSAGKMLLVVGLAGAEETAQHQLELLASFEAALRCAPGLQRRVPLTCAEFEVTETVAYSADWAVARCIRWAAQPDLQLTTDKAERLLAAAAALACTVCKCGVLHAAAEATAAAEADAAGAQHAAGSGAGPDAEAGAGAAGAPPPPTRPSAALTDLLPILAANCELLGEAVLLHADPSDRSHSLLRCIHLQQAEVCERLLHLLPSDAWDDCLQRLQEAGVLPLPALAQQRGEEAVAGLRALAAAGRCCHMGCTNLAGGSEAELPTKRCSGCSTARFCSEDCSKAAWRAGHKQVCRLLAAAAVMAAEENAAGSA